MAWSKWKEHDGKGYPAPVGTLTRTRTYGGLVGQGCTGESGTPEGLSSWSWRIVDGTPHCYKSIAPYAAYQIWTDEAEKRQVEALKELIKDPQKTPDLVSS